jgi:hypothetical protein
MKNLAALIRTQWDRAGALGLVVVGLLALLFGWIGMSGAVLTYEQLPYILSGGLFGLSLITVGTGLWLSADIRDEWRRIDRLEEALRDRGGVAERDQDIRIPDVTSDGGPQAHRSAESVDAGRAPRQSAVS